MVTQTLKTKSEMTSEIVITDTEANMVFDAYASCPVSELNWDTWIEVVDHESSNEDDCTYHTTLKDFWKKTTGLKNPELESASDSSVGAVHGKVEKWTITLQNQEETGLVTIH